jgi:hypothetical protein
LKMNNLVSQHAIVIQYNDISNKLFNLIIFILNIILEYYSCSERIILSGIAFLELPKIILELQKRLPPTLEIAYPPKRIYPSII